MKTDTQSVLWRYLSEGQRSLLAQGDYLLQDVETHVPTHPVTDYSYLVFPFAKAYEGFLKQYFLDLGLIKQWQYESDHFRIGKALSPNLVTILKKRSVYRQLTEKFGNSDLADDLWRVWRRGRNLIFHYFPHNLKAIDLIEAKEIISDIQNVMERAVVEGKVG